MDDVRAVLDAVGAERAALALSDAFPDAPIHTSFYEPDRTFDDLVAYQYYGHKREHCAQIDVYRDRLIRGTTATSSATAT